MGAQGPRDRRQRERRQSERRDSDRTTRRGRGAPRSAFTGSAKETTRGSEPRRQSTVTKPRRAASNEGRSRLGDLTRPVAREHAITRRWSSTFVFAVVAGTIAVALAVTLFVLPVRTWLQQSDELSSGQAQLDELESINDDLQAEVDKLRTPQGAEEAIRKEIGMIAAGENPMTIMEAPRLPANLPDGWPYSAVTNIFQVRRSAERGGAAQGNEGGPPDQNRRQPKTGEQSQQGPARGNG